MRWQLYEQRGSPYTCCFCCHVRIGTMFLGAADLIWSLVTIVMSFAMPSSLFTDGFRLQASTTRPSISHFTRENDIMAAYTEPMNNTTWASSVVQIHGDRRAVDLAVNIGTALFTVSLLYGVAKARAKLLLPYFCLQIFDFCLNALVIIGFFTYEPNVKPRLALMGWLPFKAYLMTLSNGWLVLIAGSFAICYLWFSAYFISIVWSCYKYLICIQTTLPLNGLNFLVETDHCASSYHPEERIVASSSYQYDASNTDIGSMNGELLMPPKYEDVLLMPDSPDSNVSSESLPPAYSDVILSEESSSRTE